MTTEEKFWNLVDQRSTDECWPWKGVRNLAGYGQFNFDGGRELSHRQAFKFRKGEILAGLFVCHRCDNPPCCNPEHLFAATPKENTADSWRKGRQLMQQRPELFRRVKGEYCNSPRGEQSWNSRLKEHNIRSIRTSADSRAVLAARFGVSEDCIYRVQKGSAWKHVK